MSSPSLLSLIPTHSGRSKIEAAVHRLQSQCRKKLNVRYVQRPDGRWAAEIPFNLCNMQDLMEKADSAGITYYAGSWTPGKGNFLSIWEAAKECLDAEQE